MTTALDTCAPGTGRGAGRGVVLLGGSTGGLEALETILASFPADCPATVVSQHMPADFIATCVERLDRTVAPRVIIAADGEPLAPGVVSFAGGGGYHLELGGRRSVALRCVPAAAADPYVPLVDRLFLSAVPHAARTVACLLSGMGKDGAAGLTALRCAGARTFAQTAASCVVDGMPGAARRAGGVETSAPPAALGPALLAAAVRA